MMTKTEDWAIVRSRIESFFRGEPDILTCGDDYLYRSCRIRLVTLEDHTIGALHFPRTRVIFEGPEEDLQSIYRRFFLRFVSAGG